jgi:hypothetical protein
MNPTHSKATSKLQQGKYLIAAAGIFHVLVSILVLLVGRLGLAGGIVDARGLGSFATDSGQYFGHAARLAALLKTDGLSAWWAAPLPIHIKLYSVSIAALGPLLGYNILAVEVLNFACFIMVLAVVFKLGEELLDQRAGLTAAIVVALWPTILIHSTQVLKDQLFIPGFLGLILICTRLLVRRFDLRAGLWHGLLGVVLVSWLWLVKADLWEFSLLVLLVTIALAAVRAARERSLAPGHLLATALLMAGLLAAPQLLGKYRKPNPHPLLTVTGSGPNQVVTINRAPGEPEPVPPPSRTAKGLSRLREKLAWARYLYANYPGSTSVIDPQVRLESWGEIIGYAPRALEIGLFAPFPKVWLEAGAKVGRSGRILSGLEMLAMYLVYGLAGVAVWRRREQLSRWLLLLVTIASLLALSIVTANLGALYRLRYPYWMLLIILGVVGAFELLCTLAPLRDQSHFPSRAKKNSGHQLTHELDSPASDDGNVPHFLLQSHRSGAVLGKIQL